MKQLTVPFLPASADNVEMKEVGDSLRKMNGQALSFVPWPAYPYKPAVRFSIAYGSSALFLYYRVEEKFIKAASGNINEPVYKDSCVEFFVGLDDETYYNFEFNCIGAVLAGFGKSKTDRKPLQRAALEKIKSEIRISRGEGAQVKWEITAVIPFAVFQYHDLTSLKGKHCKANFYKCGDDLPEPHFLTWSNIESKEPDFHLPQFFGALQFQ